MALPGGAWARAETLHLSCLYTPGDVAQVERIFTTDFTKSTTIGEVRTAQSRAKVTNKYSYLQTIVATWPTGRPQTMRRFYQVATATRSSPGRPPSTETTHLQGQSATVTDRDGAPAITGPTGLDPDGTRLLSQALVEDIERYPLTGDRQVGDTWPLPPEVSAVVVLGARCTGTCKLEAIQERSGLRCARLAIRGSIDGIDPGGAHVTATMRGTLYWSIALKRAIENTVDADMKAEFTTSQGADVVQVINEGTLHMSRKIRWTALAGRELKAP